MTIWQRFNPLYLRRELSYQKEVNSHYAKQLMTYEARNLTLEQQLANSRLVSEKFQNEIDRLEKAYLESYEHQKALLQSATSTQEQIKKELECERAKNRRWFQLVLQFTPDDFVLMNKALWGHKLELVPAPKTGEECK